VLRLAGYILSVFALLWLLRLLPGVGDVFQVPFLGFFLAAAILSALVGGWTAWAVTRRKTRNLEREFGAVETPHNQGKLGVLLLNAGRVRRALPHLERAAEGESDRAEWHYRLGVARLSLGDAHAAVLAFERALATDPEHAFGAPRLRLAEARLASNDAQGSLEAAQEFERWHGPTAESAFRTGAALRALGRRDESRRAFRRVAELAVVHSRGVRREGTGLAAKAWFLARF
jgi:tetratricopeptide (TPR) repeat protein